MLFRVWALLLVSAVTEVKAESMIWLADADPGEEKRVTLDEQTRDMILAKVEGVDFVIEQTNALRGLKRLKSEPNICVSDKIYNDERKRFSLASRLPQVVVPGLRLFIRKNAQTADLQRMAGTHSLRKIMAANPTLNIGVVKGRSYGDELDSLLNHPAWQNRIWKRSSTDMGAGVLAMLFNHRIDGVLEFPVVVNTFLQQQTRDVNLIPLTVSETSEFTEGFVLCSRSAQGQRAIDAINDALYSVTSERAYLDAHLKWFDRSLHEQLTAYYNQVYRTDFTLNSEP